MKNSQDTHSTVETRRRIASVMIGVAIVAAGTLVVWKITAPAPPPEKPSGDASGETTPPPGTAQSPDPQRLVGRWVRTDSPYVIEIRSVDAGGDLEARYLNPNPINVSRAEARDNNGTLEVFVELRDVNYPGSNYKLVYHPDKDALLGVYFQAVQKQRYDVAFVRLKSER